MLCALSYPVQKAAFRPSYGTRHGPVVKGSQSASIPPLRLEACASSAHLVGLGFLIPTTSSCLFLLLVCVHRVFWDLLDGGLAIKEIHFSQH